MAKKEDYKKNKGGRPRKYKEEFNEQAEKLCKLGAKDIELADFFNVCEDTIHTWKQDFPKFSESLNRGKDVFDTRNVENSLRTRATGMVITEERQTTRKLKMGEGDESEGEVVDTTITKKEIAPDTTAAIFWLKNRNPERWRDKQEVEQTSTNINYNSEVSKEEAKNISDALEDEY